MSIQERPAKPVSASRTEQAQILMYDTLNGYKRLFGGRLMEGKGIHLAPAYNGCVAPITLQDEHGDIHFWLLPFVQAPSIVPSLKT